jgi:hypothetical protein
MYVNGTNTSLGWQSAVTLGSHSKHFISPLLYFLFFFSLLMLLGTGYLGAAAGGGDDSGVDVVGVRVGAADSSAGAGAGAANAGGPRSVVTEHRLLHVFEKQYTLSSCEAAGETKGLSE